MVRVKKRERETVRKWNDSVSRALTDECEIMHNYFVADGAKPVGWRKKAFQQSHVGIVNFTFYFYVKKHISQHK